MTWELLHGGLGPGIAAALSAVSFLCSLMTVAFGIGGGAVMLGVMATLLPAPVLIPLHGLVQFGSNVGRTALLFRHIRRSVVIPFLIGSVVGVAVGGAFVVQLNAGMIRIGVGCFILWTILFSPPTLMRGSASLTGLFSSFLTMFFGGTGPFVAAYVKTLDTDRLGYSATHALLMTTQHLLKTFAFALLGFAFSQWIGLVALLISAGFLGTLAGRHILVRVDEARFRRVLNGILVVLALQLIVTGALQLLREGQAPGL